MADKQFVADSAALLDIYKRAALLKANDERARKVILSGQVAMVYYSYRGQEIIPSVMGNVLRDDDTICTIYRGIHDIVAKGTPLNDIFAELYGKLPGTCKGKGGPMHLSDPASGLMITTGIVGAGLPIANGLGLAEQLRGTDKVCVCNFGDGATSIGAFHEALNLAAVWKLPVIYVIENNQYAMGTSVERSSAVSDFSKRGASFGIPGVQVDGMDVRTVREAAARAINHARSGEGPYILEMQTYRYRGHSMSDPAKYRTKDEVSKMRDEHDPIEMVRKRLLEAGAEADPGTQEQMRQRLKAELTKWEKVIRTAGIQVS